MHWILSPEPVEPKSSFPVIADIISNPNHISCTADKKTWLQNALKISPEVNQQIEADTIGQMENQAWCIARKMRLTASNFGSLLRAVRLNRYYFNVVLNLMCFYVCEFLNDKCTCFIWKRHFKPSWNFITMFIAKKYTKLCSWWIFQISEIFFVIPGHQNLWKKTAVVSLQLGHSRFHSMGCDTWEECYTTVWNVWRTSPRNW